MPYPLETGILCVFKPDGTTARTGFLVLKSLAVTCAHVVTSKGLQEYALLEDKVKYSRFY